MKIFVKQVYDNPNEVLIPVKYPGGVIALEFHTHDMQHEVDEWPGGPDIGYWACWCGYSEMDKRS